MAHGTFDVKVVPIESHDADAGVGRFAIAKVFQGDISGTGSGEMLSGGDPRGSGAYVAIERITGTLEGREGSFMLMHRGVMLNQVPTLEIAVVPGSGAGALAGIAGTFLLTIANGVHSWEFDYTLP